MKGLNIMVLNPEHEKLVHKLTDKLTRCMNAEMLKVQRKLGTDVSLLATINVNAAACFYGTVLASTFHHANPCDSVDEFIGNTTPVVSGAAHEALEYIQAMAFEPGDQLDTSVRGQQ